MNTVLLFIILWVWVSIEILIWFKMPSFPGTLARITIAVAALLWMASAVSSQERMIAVELSEAQWNAVAKAIQKEPFGEVVVIMSELQRQVRAAIARDAAELARLKAENEQLRGTAK